ncbi:PREDICTED: DDRGK domain-containing protein 1 isoform X1 [Colobus angolensis palliatus]|uniref:DDRGK domain-containing protein 1 isoform X1 n=1 Tax=Colobus angolensis palliatus TaxID=336983 RepID=UPI0005F43302|nr:PREDICTED: DDRGK domain-containing protein 1 isoform X1 [Colobus angolensis palliatus]
MVAPVWYLVAAALLVGFILFLTRSRGRAASASQESLHNEELAGAGRVAQPGPLQPEEPRAEGRPRRRRDLGSRLQAQRRAQRVAWAEADENEQEAVILAQEEEDIEKSAETHVSGKIGAKKLRKLEEKQARKAQREAEEAEREERKRLESQREAEWKKEEERLRLEEEQKEEEERKAREEQAQREHEEYLKLKEAFVVEEEGVGETMTEEQSQSFLTEFISYIKVSSHGTEPECQLPAWCVQVGCLQRGLQAVHSGSCKSGQGGLEGQSCRVLARSISPHSNPEGGEGPGSVWDVQAFDHFLTLSLTVSLLFRPHAQ